MCGFNGSPQTKLFPLATVIQEAWDKTVVCTGFKHLGKKKKRKCDAEENIRQVVKVLCMCTAVSWPFLSTARALGLQEIPVNKQCQSPQNMRCGLSCMDVLCATDGANDFTTCTPVGSRDWFDLTLNGSEEIVVHSPPSVF